MATKVLISPPSGPDDSHLHYIYGVPASEGDALLELGLAWEPCYLPIAVPDGCDPALGAWVTDDPNIFAQVHEHLKGQGIGYTVAVVRRCGTCGAVLGEASDEDLDESVP